MMSLPSASWTSTVEAGVNLCVSPFEMRLESDAFFGDAAQVGQAENLEAAGIGEDRAGPGHEAMQAASSRISSWPGRRKRW